MKKVMYLIIFLMSMTSIDIQAQSCSIDFGDYSSASFNSSNCTYLFNGVFVSLIGFNDFGEEIPICGSGEDPWIARIMKPNIPLIGESIRVTTNGGLETMTIRYKYIGQELSEEFFDESIVIDDFSNLEFIDVLDIECTLLGSECGLSPASVALEVVDPVIPNIPSNPTAQQTETTLSGLTDDYRNGINDYHYYEVDNEICNSQSNSNCTVDNVYNFIKNNREFQVPQYLDFPQTPADILDTDPIAFLKRLINNRLLTDEITNLPAIDGDTVIIGGNDLRLLAGIAGLILNQALEECSGLVNINSDPVVISLHDEGKSITNYTLPGHTLHPGKITRFVYSEDCGQTVRVRTIGEGLHFCGDTPYGVVFSFLNIGVGRETFQNMDNRLIIFFN
ncbi:hypothetical protein QWY85_05695 [Neolewinella lacunae]|uniref:Uncharacterized protein n=1 Tax=Neolewinella lacunae TaxID=1517758 RepID=A0A923PH63_9BACT|nr:hypothetical protein [Neolewinella lacunae]MBC6993209.1 hypothetical protein [Neolewinella lacunae]MDN3634144.1 hypothetical protein [Neolewinella lacunae]